MPQNYQFQDPNIVRLLWTSGWDSTFRLLRLVIEEERTVLPIYIISDRSSAPVEIKRMNELKKLIVERFPQTADRILETVFYYVRDIKKYPEITQKYETLLAKSHLGNQYEWLSRYAKQHGINDLELCIHVDDTAYKFIKNFIVRMEDEHGEYYSVDQNMSDDNLLSFFKPFRYPVLEWSKVKMKEHVIKTGTLDIMNRTWFCHRPINGKPCGLCNPCKYTIEEGMEYRLPKSALLRYRLKPLYVSIKKANKAAHKLYSLIKAK